MQIWVFFYTFFMNNNYCIIMAGGIGSRFWPLSTTETPKQFLDILGIGKSLLRLTFNRMLHVCPAENIFIVTNMCYEDLVLEQLPEISSAQVLKEPLRRNTAPCIAYGVHVISKINPQANIIVTPADHLIVNEISFKEILYSGIDLVSKNNFLVTIGIKPSRPDTGYGYIQVGEVFSSDNNIIVNKVKTFTEKPDLDIAKIFCSSGDFFWNSGIFLWSVSSILSAFESLLPQIHTLFEKDLQNCNDFEELSNVYSQCQNISIDYGIMEKANNVFVIQADFGWSDLGTWGALYEHVNKDVNHNAIISDDCFLYDSNNCMISLPKDKIAVVSGLDNYIIIDSGDKLLICSRFDEQKIRQYVNDIKVKKGDRFV